MNEDVDPGAAVDFAIVFEDLPENVSHFEVEPVGSRRVEIGGSDVSQ